MTTNLVQGKSVKKAPDGICVAKYAAKVIPVVGIPLELENITMMGANTKFPFIAYKLQHPSYSGERPSIPALTVRSNVMLSICDLYYLEQGNRIFFDYCFFIQSAIGDIVSLFCQMNHKYKNTWIPNNWQKMAILPTLMSIDNAFLQQWMFAAVIHIHPRGVGLHCFLNIPVHLMLRRHDIKCTGPDWHNELLQYLARQHLIWKLVYIDRHVIH